MDPMQIPVPTAPVAPAAQMQNTTVPQQAPAPAAVQEDLFDKILKGLVSFVASLVNKPTATTTAPTVPLGVNTAPQMSQADPMAAQVPVAPTIAPQINQIDPMAAQVPVAQTVAPEAQNIIGNIGSTLGNVANQAVNVAQTGVNNVVQNAQNYITEPAPTAPAVDVQNFLAQNYQTNIPPQATTNEPIAPQQ